MRNTKKKGFTIVELVIVVAVIAILSSVMIPTVAGLIEKANLSADQVAVRNMNNALAMTDGVEDIDDAIDALAEAGFNSKKALIPVSAGHSFLWYADTNQIVLAKGEQVVFPEGVEYKANGVDLEGCYKYVDVTATTVKQLKEALQEGNEYIKLEYSLDIRTQLYVKENSNITLDLNGKILDSSNMQTRPFLLANGSNLTINATGSTVNCADYGLVEIPSGVNGATVTINGGSYVADLDDASFIKVRGNSNKDNSLTVNLNNVNYTDTSTDRRSKIMDMDGYEGKLTLNIDGGVYNSKRGGFHLEEGVVATIKNTEINAGGFAIECAGSLTISNSKITTKGSKSPNGSSTDTDIVVGAVCVSYEGNITINNCEITAEGDAACLYVYPTNGTITVTGSTFTGTQQKFHDGADSTKSSITIN